MSSLDLIDSMGVDDSENLITQNGTEEEEEEALTALEVIKRLETAWINESKAPELLEPQIEVVECLLGQIKEIEASLEELEKGHFGIAIHKMELARIRFMIASYLRLRLQKIQKYVHYLSKKSDDYKNTMLTTEEATFLEKFKKNTDDLFKKLALDHIPQRSADFSKFGENSKFQLDRNIEAPNPNLNATVFVKANEDIRGVLIEDEADQGREEEMDMEKNSQHVLRYKSVSHLVQLGKVRLV